MKTRKCNTLCRLMALALALVMAAGMIPAAALAAQTTQIIVEQGHAMPGDTVKLDVLLQNNTGISNALLKLNYDDSLELVQAERGDALTYLFFTKPAVFASPCNFLWDSLAGEDTEDGMLLTLTFKVKEDAAAGQNAFVWFEYGYGDISDADDQPVNVSIVKGFVEIIDYTPGDLNADKLINGIDVALLRQFILGDPVTVRALAGDVNGDERVNGTDVVVLRRNIAGGYGVDLVPGREPCLHGTMTATAAVAADCKTAGNIAYWHCADCNRYFVDAAGTERITFADTVVAALGHTEVTDPAVAPTYDTAGLTEGSHCSVCEEVIISQQTIEPLGANYHAITYMELYGAPSPEPTRYAEHEGLLDLPVPERPGYAFLGWFTSTDGGEAVDYIPKGSTRDYVLFAKWEKEVYSIYYFDAPEHSNVDSYTVDDRIVLSEPRWSGLKFTGWTDQNGDPVTEIRKGSTGDLELTANWKLLRNIANPGNTKGLLMTYDPDNECYHFIYELGVIEHVVLEEVALGSANLKFNSGATDLTFTLEESVTIGDSTATSIAKTVAESVSRSTEWEKAYEWGSEESNAHNVSVGVSTEVDMGVVAATLEAEYGYTNTTTESWGKSEVTAGSVETGSENVNSTASSVSYMKQISSSVATSFTISKDMPEGYYSYVHAGNVRVFGVVTYSPKDNSFFLDTYSIVDNMHEMMLYYRDVAELNDQSTEELSYNIPRDRILEIVDNSYFIRYNGGTADGGEMPMTVQMCRETVILPENQFVKTGYTFQDWEVNGGEHWYRDGAQVVELGEKGEIVDLTARWGANNYEIKYHANTPGNATAEVTGMPEDLQCVYDQPVTLSAAPALTGWTFAGWYRDAECTEKLGDAEQYFEAGNFTDAPNGVVDAYAKWASNEMLVTLDAAGGWINGQQTATYTMQYNNTYSELPTPTLDGFVFLGWYLGEEQVDMQTRIVTEEDHTLVAKWLRYKHTTRYDIDYGYWDKDAYEYPGHRFRVDDEDGVYDQAGGWLDKAALKSMGYTKYVLHVKFDAHGCTSKGYIDVWFCNSEKGRLQNVEHEMVKYDHDYHTLECSVEISIDALDDAANFYIEYGGNGSGTNEWLMGDAFITITAKR